MMEVQVEGVVFFGDDQRGERREEERGKKGHKWGRGVGFVVREWGV